MSDDVPWGDAAVTQLRALWAEGLSATAIGREMRRTKNAIIAKVHRLGLPERDSPIRRRAEGVVVPAEPPPQVMRRRGAGGDPLPPFHPIAAEVLAEAGLVVEPPA